MNISLRNLALLVTTTSALALGGAAAYAESDLGADPAVNESGIDCYGNTVRLTDPNDFCYKVMGPWNSTPSTPDEVRAIISLETMIDLGDPEWMIQRYYPEYKSITK